MVNRPRLLDLFCCAGGAGTGYSRAGFDVVGVDIAPQPNYPFEFHQGEALKYLAEHGHEFDAVHLSPPCQGYTTMSNKHQASRSAHPRLIEPARAAAVAAGLPYVIENVAGARSAMRAPIKLSGGMFGLGVDRPRLFESNVPLTAPLHQKAEHIVGVYGPLDGRLLWTRRDGTQLRAARTLTEGQKAMGIDWMAWNELTEAIPPAYTEHIGQQLLAHIDKEVAA